MYTLVLYTKLPHSQGTQRRKIWCYGYYTRNLKPDRLCNLLKKVPSTHSSWVASQMPPRPDLLTQKRLPCLYNPLYTLKSHTSFLVWGQLPSNGLTKLDQPLVFYTILLKVSTLFQSISPKVGLSSSRNLFILLAPLCFVVRLSEYKGILSPPQALYIPVPGTDGELTIVTPHY